MKGSVACEKRRHAEHLEGNTMARGPVQSPVKRGVMLNTLTTTQNQEWFSRL